MNRRTEGHSVCFDDAFFELTGHRPFPWQKRLYDRLARGDVPSVCDIPTGLGKTAVIPIWLIAMAHDSNKLPRRLVYVVNRRTVVDQATREAERIRENLGKPELAELAKRLRELCALQTGAADQPAEPPLAISTLRGQFADNGEWRADPSRPAIIVGTVDMIGSRLLFSGYGRGFKSRPLHAGFLGQDALLVHDEAHLEPAFQELLMAIEREQKRSHEVSKLRVMKLSATSRRNGTEGREDEPFELTNEEKNPPEDIPDPPTQPIHHVWRRLKAKKQLSFVEADAGKKNGLVDAISEQAIRYDEKKCRVLVYVHSPKAAAAVRDAIAKAIVNDAKEAGCKPTREDTTKRIGLLTGTIRGFERDQLAESNLFEAFKADPNRQAQLEHTLYLVSTSAGEVGVDLDADHLVCDLTTLESMAQRFGRVNRLGGTDAEGNARSARITVVVEKEKPVEVAFRKETAEPQISAELKKEFEWVEAKGRKGPKIKFKNGLTRATAERAKALWEGDKDVEKAIDDALDKRAKHTLESAIAMTSEKLRQIAEDRGDVSPAALARVLADAKDAFSPPPNILLATDILFDAWALTTIRDKLPGRPPVEPYLHGISEWQPPETHVAWRAEIDELGRADVSIDDLEEMLDLFPIRAVEQLRNRTDRVYREIEAMAKRHPDAKAILIVDDKPRWLTLSEVAPANKEQKKAALRRLEYATVVLPVEIGGLRGGMMDGGSDAPVQDVAEVQIEGQKIRQRIRIAGDAKTALLGDDPAGGLIVRHRISMAQADPEDEDSGPAVTIEYRVEKRAGTEPGQNIPLSLHNRAVECVVRRMGKALNLSNDLVEALTLAGRGHDCGKDRPVWQRYARNPDPSTPLAKSERYLHGRALGGYRHEFGSLLDVLHGRNGAPPPQEFVKLSEDMKDLVLHLIAAHHGFARPHFPADNAFDHERSTREWHRAAAEVPRRFARLQRKYGRWGLAYLESLLRAADWAASADPSAFVEQQDEAQP